MKTQNLPIQKLAEKLGYSIWIKGDLKRIYLNDEGYNTKKMSTKTFIFEKDGEFIVSCHIECASQPYQWINSQEKEIEESVYNRIEKIIEKETATSVFVVTVGDKFLNSIGREVTVDEIDDIDVFYSIEKANSFLKESNYNGEITSFTKEVFREIQDNWIKNNPKPVEEPKCKIKEPAKEFITSFMVGEIVVHAKWGNVEVISENETIVVVKHEGNAKQLLKKFAPLNRMK
jgi:hypothetical protein